MPLVCVGVRTDSITHTHSYEAWPTSAHVHWRSTQDMYYYALRVLHFSAFHVLQDSFLECTYLFDEDGTQVSITALSHCAIVEVFIQINITATYELQDTCVSLSLADVLLHMLCWRRSVSL